MKPGKVAYESGSKLVSEELLEVNETPVAGLTIDVLAVIKHCKDPSAQVCQARWKRSGWLGALPGGWTAPDAGASAKVGSRVWKGC